MSSSRPDPELMGPRRRRVFDAVIAALADGTMDREELFRRVLDECDDIDGRTLNALLHDMARFGAVSGSKRLAITVLGSAWLATREGVHPV